MSKQQAVVMWVIWFGMLQGAFLMHFVLAGGFPEGANAEEPMAVWLWVASFLPLVLATVLRWLVIPRLREQARMLVALLVGLSLAELPIFVSLFLIGGDYPQNQIAVLIPAVLCLIQLAPSYATPGYGDL